MAKRRPMGALETRVLEELWGSGGALTPAQVQAAIDGDLAYTTVMTILTRLWKKGQVTRSRSGRLCLRSDAVSGGVPRGAYGW